MNIQKQLDRIYRDLERNVTKIYERREIHLAYDLAWHSVLQFEFNGQMLTRGWVEVLVVGDTRCGKTKTAERLLKHYRAGEMGTGENTSLAGLLGGMQQLNKQWSIIWGKYPRNDRRLIIIDEASNLNTDHIASFATARSEGIARITKVQTEQTHCRTRSIWISNPRANRDGVSRPISAYDYGVSTIPELIGRQADIARFDLACVVANGEVPDTVIFQRADPLPVRGPVFSSSACQSLILWAWSRAPSDVKITQETVEEIMLISKNMARKYHDSIPLVKLEEFPEKLARLSVALATRLFNSPDGHSVLVLPEHASYIASFLDSIYSRPNMGYLQYSKRLIESENLDGEPEIISRISKFGNAFVHGMLRYDIIRQNVIEDLTGLDRDGVRAFTSFLVRTRALNPEHTWYRKSTPFIALLKRIESGKVALIHHQEEY